LLIAIAKLSNTTQDISVLFNVSQHNVLEVVLVLPKHIQVVHYETLPTRLQWFKLCGSINIIDFISKRETMARGGHHSVKMVTAVWPQQGDEMCN